MAHGQWGAALYRGDKSYNFVGRQRLWYAISGAILLTAIIGLATRGLNESIEFKGGDVFQFSANGHSVKDARDVVTGLGLSEPIVTETTAPGQGHKLSVQTKPIDSEETTKVENALAQRFGLQPGQVATQQVGPTWGKQITRKAILSLIVFMVLVVLFISVRFEFKMAIAAIVALLHDLLITIGVYAVLGFQISPATVIGLLTILGYSLYDTVVVFDKVRENTAGIAGGNRSTYSQAANLAVNQTLVRSINTSVIALLPVAAILFIGSLLLGAGTLKDLSLALFVGLASGTYSSIFIATPLLASMKEREPQMQLLARRVDARVAAGKPAGATAGSGAAAAVSARTQTTATAVLDRDDDQFDDDGDGDGGDDGRVGSGMPVSGAAAQQQRRQQARQQPKRRKGRGGRPRSKKRR
ncbi:MAG: protein translocase subunit SecF [Actinomycetes bacterium]